MEFLRYESSPPSEKRPGSNHSICISALGELKRLANVFSVHDFGLDRLPQPALFKSLAGGDTVRGVLRIRDRNMKDAGLTKVIQRTYGAGLRPYRDSAIGIHEHRGGIDQALLRGIRHVAFARRKQHIERRAVRDLLSKFAAGSERKANRHAHRLRSSRG